MKKLLLLLLCLPLLFSCGDKDLAIGDTHQGGIIFYLDANGGGLIAAPSDQHNLDNIPKGSPSAVWGCYKTSIQGADGTSVGTGNQNTIDIINANCSPFLRTNAIAVNFCSYLTLGGYSDWFLPSKDELNQMYLNIGQGNALGLGNVGGFANGYWSSTEFNGESAWRQWFLTGFQTNDFKFGASNVRAIRAF